MTPEFVVQSKRTLRGKRWWVALVAENGETLSHTEQLNSESAALGNIDAQKDCAARARTHIIEGPK